MKIDDLFIYNLKEIKSLMRLKLPLKKSTEQLILSTIHVSPFTNNFTRFCSIIQLWRGKIIERVFALRLFRKKPQYCEVIRRIEGNSLVAVKNMYFTTCGGYKVAWTEKVMNWYWNNKQFDHWFYASYKYYNVCIENRLYNIDDIINLDSSLKYCAWSKGNLTYWITIYRKYPEIELLSKLEMQSLINNIRVLENLKLKKFKKYLISCKGFNNITGKDILYGFNHDMSIKEVYERNENIKINKEINKNILYISEKYPQLNKEKLKNYLFKYRIQKGYYLNERSYVDMLEAETFLHLDLSDDKNVFPHDFDYWHNYYINQYQTAKDKYIDESIANQIVKYNKLEKNIDSLKIILATSSQDLINEGEELNHCVGRMGYNKKMAKGESLILFVRKQEDINKSFITMEYDPNHKKIIQLYGFQNTPPTEDIKHIIYNKWLPKVKKISFI